MHVLRMQAKLDACGFLGEGAFGSVIQASYKFTHKRALKFRAVKIPNVSCPSAMLVYFGCCCTSLLQHCACCWPDHRPLIMPQLE